MWQVIYITNEKEANSIKDKLIEHGFLVKLEAMDDGTIQIKVPQSEAEEVYQILSDTI